jgi:GNAT superfamily N-acetyltransferase
MVVVSDAVSVSQLDSVRHLMRSFIAWHRERHVEDLALIDSYFDADAFEHELATLPGIYVPPRGRLLLATVDDAPAGCVALRAIDNEFCEMKRMFVYPRFHGKGVGLALGQRLIECARQSGYRAMRLDTSIRQAEATGLYRRFGFTPIAPYYELPQNLRDWLVFMELGL